MGPKLIFCQLLARSIAAGVRKSDAHIRWRGPLRFEPHQRTSQG
jgi:hypothetical protein